MESKPLRQWDRPLRSQWNLKSPPPLSLFNVLFIVLLFKLLLIKYSEAWRWSHPNYNNGSDIKFPSSKWQRLQYWSLGKPLSVPLHLCSLCAFYQVHHFCLSTLNYRPNISSLYWFPSFHHQFILNLKINGLNHQTNVIE